MTNILILILLAATPNVHAAKPTAKEKLEAFCGRRFEREKSILELQNLPAKQAAIRTIEILGNLSDCFDHPEGVKVGQ